MILAVLLPAFLPVTRAQASPARLTRISPTLIEITGGEGKQAWRLQYGTKSHVDLPQTLFVTAGEDRAWFSHMSWLRLIDTRRGVVLGRWHFPSQIMRLVPEGSRVQVEVKAEDGATWDHIRRTVTFDPNSPKIPFWLSSYLLLFRLPAWEADFHQFRPDRVKFGPYGAAPGSGFASAALAELSAQEAKGLIPELEEALRRDPFSPWMRVTLGKLLADVGDSRAVSLMQQAVELPADYTELFPISAFLHQHGYSEQATTAFERGYRDFYEHGNDPRLLPALIGRLIMFHEDISKLNEAQRKEYLERVYRVGPWAEGAVYAWQIHARSLAAVGRTVEAQTWRERAGETARRSLYIGELFTRPLDRFFGVLCASIVAALFYLLVVCLRYGPQARLVAAIGRRQGRLQSLLFRRLEYWSRRERIAFLGIALTGWFAAGLAGPYVQGWKRYAEKMPLSFYLGSFASFPSAEALQSSVPVSRERDLLLALALQQSGETARAEQLYRGLPQFPQAWNNLGVLLKKAGRESEAQRAFEQALRMEPGMAEAAFNLGRPPSDLWTQNQARYLPGQPMLAPPTPQHMFRAFLGVSFPALLVRSLAGPFGGALDAHLSEYSGYHVFGPEPWGPRIAALLLIAITILALALAFVVPHRDVTEGPERSQHFWEVLFPGTSPRWNVLGGLALVAWFWVLIFGVVARGELITAYLMPNPDKSYGLVGSRALAVRLATGSPTAFYIAAIVLFVVNLLVVFGPSAVPRRAQTSPGVGQA